MVERAAYIDTQKLLKQLQRSVKDYYIVNGQLPCVASLQDAPGTTEFGVAIPNCASTTSEPTGTFRTGSPAVRIGMIPTRTLGLPDSAASDKYGNRIVYAVTELLTDSNQFGLQNGAITVWDMNDNAILSDAAFYISSFGRDRKGAYNYQTTGAPSVNCSPAANLDTQNCDFANAVFRDAPYNNGDVEDRFFDDLTAWTPKFHLTGMTASSDTLWAANGDANLFSVGTDGNTSNTNVGIGLSAPQHSLDVSGVIQTRNGHIVTNNANGALVLNFPQTGTNPGLFVRSNPTPGNVSTPYATLMRVFPDGDVGIGTESPEERLHVAGNLQVANAFLGIGAHGGNYLHLAHPNYKGSGQYALLQHATIGHLYLNSVADGNIYFRNDNVSQMTLQGETGFLGIDTSAPQAGLHVKKIGRLTPSNKLGSYPPGENNSFAAIIEGLGADDGGLFIRIGDNNGDEKALDIWNEASDSLAMRVKSNGRSSFGGDVRSDAMLTVSGGPIYTGAMWLGKSGATATAPDIQFDSDGLLGADGNVFVAIDGNNNGSGMFSVRRGRMHRNGTELLRMRHNGKLWIASNLQENSDKRLKKDIRPISDALDKLAAINGVHFLWNGKANHEEKPYIGVIAQEVQSVFPELVEKDHNGYLALDKAALVAPLIEAVKQLDAENTLLDQKNAALHEKLQSLETRIKTLENETSATADSESATGKTPQNIALFLFILIALGIIIYTLGKRRS